MSPSPEAYRSAATLRAGLRRFAQASQATLRAHGLTPERYELLLAIRDLEENGEPATVSALTSELGVAQASATQLVRRAEDVGLLRREVCSTDARVRYLRLTELGAKQLAEAVASLTGERERLLAVLHSVRDPADQSIAPDAGRRASDR